MPAEPIGRCGDGNQHRGQPQVVAHESPTQQRRVADFVGSEACGRKQEEATRSRCDGRAVAAKREPMMPEEGHAKGNQPTANVGDQGRQAERADHHDNDAEVDGRRGATDSDEPTGPLGHGRLPPMRRIVHAQAQYKSARRVAVCVDDFGLHPGINQATLQLADMARVNAIGCMVGGPAFAAGSRQLSSLDRQGIDIGLHLDITAYPQNPSSRRSLPSWIASAYSARLDEELLREEIQAQLDAFEQALGCRPAFVDGHQHVHQLPGIGRLLIETLDQRGGSPRPWLRSTRWGRAGQAMDGQTVPSGLKPRLIEALGAAAFSRKASRCGYLQNGCLLGVYDFSGGPQRYLKLLRGWFAVAGDGDLLMCHPSRPIQADDPILAARLAEFEVLVGGGFADALDESRVTLSSMSRILAAD